MPIFDQFVEAVRLQLQPQPRAMATANTLQQLSIYVPNDVTLADLIVGWRILSQPLQPEEEVPITKRRITCGELADVASQFTIEQGNIAQAIKTWRVWADVDAFKTGDPRHNTMLSTFARELAELQAAH